MQKDHAALYLAAGLVLVCGLLLCAGIFGFGALRRLTPAAPGRPDFAATLQALVTAGTVTPGASTPTTAQTLIAAGIASPAGSASTPSVSPSDEPSGHIVLTCQLGRTSEQICIMNADGSNYHKLTTEANFRQYYASLSSDGRSVVYSQYREDNVYEVYEFIIADDATRRLTDKLGVLNAPEISPDGTLIAFTRWTVASNQYQIWVMDRDGTDPRRVFKGTGWDPTWSPDGTKILFASDMDGSTQLYVVGLDGSALHKISSLPSVRGRSDWSSRNQIATYSGDSWKREIYVMNADGSNSQRVSPPGGNGQGPSFSPDGQWIAFTAYYDHFKDINGCEIYIMRSDGQDLRRLTDNDYCDYQPRWGP